MQRLPCLFLHGTMSYHLQPIVLSHFILQADEMHSVSVTYLLTAQSCNSTSHSKLVINIMCHSNQELSRTETGKPLLQKKQSKKLYNILNARTFILCQFIVLQKNVFFWMWTGSKFKTFCTGHYPLVNDKKYLYGLNYVPTKRKQIHIWIRVFLHSVYFIQ